MPKKKTKQKQKVVLLFGAGASYGSFGLIRAPPLGKDLFDSLIEKYPKTWGSIDSSYKKTFIDHFETGMDDYVRDKNDKANNCLVDMAYYFSEFQINYPDDNLFCKLFKTFKNELVDGDICIATTNYECLIEYALRHNGLLLNYWGDVKGPRLLKIHGSCNFTWPVEVIPTGTREAPGESIVRMKMLGELVDHPPWIMTQLLKATGVIPAMSYYAPGKKTNTGSDIIKGIRQAYESAVGEANQLIIVGIRPNASDDHIWSSIQNMKGDASIVCSRDDYSKYVKKDKLEFIGERFDYSYNSICKRIEIGLQEK